MRLFVLDLADTLVKLVLGARSAELPVDGPATGAIVELFAIDRMRLGSKANVMRG